MDSVGREGLLPNIIARHAEQRPDQVFVEHVDGRVITYSQFHEDVLRWATALRRLGVSRGDNVLNMQPNDPNAYQSWLGLAWLGAVEVPLNTAYRGKILQYTADWSDARVWIVSQRYLDAVAEVIGDLPKIETLVVWDAIEPVTGFAQRVVTGAELFDGVVPARDFVPPDPWDLSCIVWTSGTTGPSKGVMIPWAEMSSTEFQRFLRPGDKTYHFWAPFHLGGKSIVFIAADVQVTLVMRETFSAGKFWDEVRAFGITHSLFSEAMAQILMVAPVKDDDADNPLRGITPYPVFAQVRKFMERFGIESCTTAYGTTEVGQLFLYDEDFPPVLEACGRLRDDFEARIVDAHDYPLGPGEIGELLVRSKHPWVLNAGYYKMPQKTAEAWVNGWFHTGDAFKYDEDGNFYFIDRMRDSIRRRGENISSFEVESFVIDHPDVDEAAAIAVASALGEDDVKVVAVRAPGSSLTEAELLDWLTEKMPRYMVPRYLEFVTDLPKTDATMKVQKAKLRRDPLNDNTFDRETQCMVPAVAGTKGSNR
ncbi:ATP-dependent acyl-CoA ligase [Amycolatopsis sp. K13G38]|uniref:ATP-dependent acyl-CoA ligase n=1 Tax=Amycolatopsis acididurans TaxID=2724524 RepID=A0ABX1JE43_9PSEU|nr:AMP-binding protein [Amycolatopsis acididurans]NKQ58062.1 ATP-dependent acyl-CoA ligase [Amycolatopsis acididurans]